MAGHSRPKDGVAPLAYDPAINEAVQRSRAYGCHARRFTMDCRVKPGNDEREAVERDVSLSSPLRNAPE